MSVPESQALLLPLLGLLVIVGLHKRRREESNQEPSRPKGPIAKCLVPPRDLKSKGFKVPRPYSPYALHTLDSKASRASRAYLPILRTEFAKLHIRSASIQGPSQPWLGWLRNGKQLHRLVGQ